MLKVKWKEM